MFFPTTTVAVRYASEDGYTAAGDPTETWALRSSGTPAHFAERSAQDNQPATTREDVNRMARLIMEPGTVVAKGDRVQDETDGTQWVVIHVFPIPKTSPIGYELVRADVEHVD